MRVKHSVLLLLAAGLLAPAFLWSQGPGGSRGFGGGQGGGFDPSAFFNMMSKGKDVIVRSELDDRGKTMFDRWADQLKITNGVITREQHAQVMSQWTQMRSNGGGSGFGGGPSGRDSGGRDSGGRDRGRDRVTITPSGGGGSSASDSQAESFFRRMDRNNDGVLSFEEMTERLQSERDKWDTNKDGFIDLNEYKGYMAARMAERNEGSKDSNNSANAPNPNTPPSNQRDPKSSPQQPQEEEDRRPVILRAGKLPKELPPWWKELDTDEDGQIGLYEWRAGGRPLEEFAQYDLNGDGLLIAEEYLKFQRIAREGDGKSGTGTLALADNPGRNGRQNFAPGGNGTGGGRTGFGGFGAPGGNGGRPGFGAPPGGNGTRPGFGFGAPPGGNGFGPGGNGGARPGFGFGSKGDKGEGGGGRSKGRFGKGKGG